MTAQLDATFAVDKFRRFWADPTAGGDAAHLAADVVGRWPDGTVVRGVKEYVGFLFRVQAVIPDIRLEPLEYAVNGEFAFIRWRGRGTGRNGAFEFFGADRIRTEGNLVTENIIHFDVATFNARAGVAFPSDIPANAVADRYLAAWQAHDVDAIMAMHTVDTTFTSAASGTDAVGQDAVRAAIEASFAVWPDLHFSPQHLHETPDLITAESIVEATQAVPLPLGDTVVQPTGKTIRFAITDVIELDNGLVRRKASYFDALDYIQRMRAATA